MKAIIIEDEEIIANILLQKINKIAGDIEIIAILPSLKKAKKWLTENAEPDLMFMDIQLSDGVSFEIFNEIELHCPVIFTTAYDEYAIRAFKLNGIDYLLKPIKDIELESAIVKFRKWGTKKDNPPVALNDLIQYLTNPAAISKYKEKFIVNFRNQWLPLSVKDIACFAKESINHIYLLNGERYTLDHDTLDEVEDLLDPTKFFRANRQFIINIEAVQSVKPIENSKLLVKLKEPNHKLEIDMSRLKSPEFKKWLDR